MSAKKAYQLKTNTIYCGDNLKMLTDIPDKSVDLVYIDPPFNSNRNYETFWGDTQQKRAFEDRFGDAAVYIDYMRPRVAEMHRVLKDTGSFYYHCDWHACHYVKVMLDEIFGFNHFLNEIIWCYSHGGKGKTHFARKHDNIFFYSKTNNYTFNGDDVGIKRDTGTKSKGGRMGVDENNRPYQDKIVKKTGKIYRYYLDVGKIPEDWWIDINSLQAGVAERLGYPTQKPIALLERIIKASSNKGDVILDAFCGCGTTLVVAEKLKRKWIGIDISPTACRVMADRLWKDFRLDEGKDFFVTDLPRKEKELRVLPHFEFENWAVIALGEFTGMTAIPGKKVGDFGIDGKLYPISSGKKKGDDLFAEAEDYYYPIQVKQKDKAGRPDIDSFETAIRRDGRKKGYFVSFDYTSGAIKEMQRLDKEGEIEIIPLTVKQLLAGNKYAA